MSDFVLRDTTPGELAEYVARQLATCFPDGRTTPAALLLSVMEEVLERTLRCFAGIEKPKFRDGGRVLFNYLHPDHYAAFLYLLANTVSRRNRADPLAFRLFYLNKVLHGLDVYHDAELPEVFQFMHPVGTVLGHARYGNYFCVYQGCSVGSDENDSYPEFGDYVVLYAGASVIGRSRVGSNVVIGATALVLNQVIPDDKVVLGGRQGLDLRDNQRHVRDRRFR